MSTVLVRDLSYRYHTGVLALDGIDLEIRAGELVVLTGPTGCGKSTLLKCLNGIIPHESDGEMTGTVTIGGKDTRRTPLSELAHSIGLLFQSPDEQIFFTRVFEEIAFGLENQRVEPARIRDMVEGALARVGMSGHGPTSTGALSGGQKQRVALAALLALRPGILVLDEPLSQLDPGGAQEVLAAVRALAEEGVTIVLVEHRLHEVAAWADRIVVMDAGRIVKDIAAADLEAEFDTFEKLGLRRPVAPSLTVASLLQGREADRELARPDSPEPEGRGGATAGSAPAVTTLQNVTFSYERPPRLSLGRRRRAAVAALDDVSLSIYPGELTAILGHNGSGKSTLLHVMAGLLRPQAGQVRTAGYTGHRYDAFALAGMVGIVFQYPALMLTCDTVRAELAFGPTNLRLGKARVAARVDGTAAAFSLEEFMGRHPQTLSGGQRLRCASAAVFAMRPKLLLLDEPTSGQDARRLDQLLGTCKRYSREGNAVVFVTHDEEMAAKHADRIVVMDRGRKSVDIRNRGSAHA